MEPEFTRFTAYPDDPYRQYKRRRNRKRPESWHAPEHQKFARHMERDYRRDVNGRKMVELGKELVLDPRPEIMQPKRTPIFLGLDQEAT